jgi:hypothetical protein
VALFLGAGTGVESTIVGGDKGIGFAGVLETSIGVA